MKKIFILIFFTIFILSCRRIIYSEYRNTDYFLITNGHHYFFDKSKTHDSAVSRKYYKSYYDDTCTCVSEINNIKQYQDFNELMIGFTFDISSFSRDLYSCFPHDGSIENIDSIKFYIVKSETFVDITEYLKNEQKTWDDVLFFPSDTTRDLVTNKAVLSNHNYCYKEFSINSILDFKTKFNNKDFHDGLKTIDYFIFLVAVSDDCPYKISNFDKLTTVIYFKTKHTRRKVIFSTLLTVLSQ